LMDGDATRTAEGQAATKPRPQFLCIKRKTLHCSSKDEQPTCDWLFAAF